MRRVKDPATGLPASARRCRAVHAARPVPYHRMATLRPEWASRTRGILTPLAAVVAFTLLASVLLVAAVLALALAPGVNLALGVTSGDPTSPLDVGLALAMGALWLPAGLVAVRVGGWRPLGTAWSVAAKVRRRLLTSSAAGVVLAGAAVVAAAGAAGAVALGLLAPDDVAPGAEGAAAGAALDAPAEGRGETIGVLRRIGTVVVIALLAPVQAIGLELTLRGIALQTVGSRVLSPIPAILAATLLALVARDLHPAVLVPALTLALCAAVLAWKSGGLEIPILFSGTVTVLALIGAAVLHGLPGVLSGAAAGLSALVAASAAPGTSNAALPETVVGSDALGSAALAGGIAGAVALLAVTAAVVHLIGTRSSVRTLEPVGRDCAAPVPDPVAV